MRKVGRPPMYETPEEMQEVIDEYFETDAYIGEGESRMFCPTVSGLAYALGMSTEAFRNYEERDEFIATVKRAKQFIEISLEQRLAGQTVTGTIFNLKNNFGWKDKQEIDQNTNLKLSTSMTDEELEAIANGIAD